MTFIPPKYKCDSCNIAQKAEWLGVRYPYWEMPSGWTESDYRKEPTEKHFCKKCSINNENMQS